MRREAQIPLFLWVATAVVVHGLGGGGATTVVQRLEETMDIKSFAKQVRRQASYAGPPVEVTLIQDEAELEELLEADKPTDAEVDPLPSDPEDVNETQPTPPKPAKEEKKKDDEKKPEQKPQPEEKPKTQPSPLAQKIKPPVIVDNRRVAVEQDVQDKEQEDNESAEFAAEHANHVKEQTRARITASDGSGSQAEMGGPSRGDGPDPGNSSENKFAQSSESEGRKDEAPGEMLPDPPRPASASQQTPSAGVSAQTPPSPPATGRQASPPPQQGQKAQEAREASEAQIAAPETLTVDGGSYLVARPRREQAEVKAQAARKATLGRQSSPSKAMLGLGSAGKTKNGVNLNLNFKSAHAVLGADHLAQVRKKAGERRLAEHRGKWQSLGLERWRPALENYVANVKPGNQTALNTARVPFSRYLNQIHQRLHEVFAHRYLGHLNQLPADHPLNNPDMSTHLEIALSREDGRVVRMGITKSSGVTLFDVGALDSVQRAAPYGPPPSSIVSSDGNVYLHWEFHRKPQYACSTYFAKPYIIDLGQKSAPPRVDPKQPPALEEKQPRPPEKKSGSIQSEHPQHDETG